MLRPIPVALLALLLAAPAAAQSDLSPVDLDLVRPHVEAGRWIWVGDSYGLPHLARVPAAALLTWEIGPIRAIAGSGWTPRAAIHSRELSAASSPETRVVTAEHGAYEVVEGLPGTERYGLPVRRLHQLRFDERQVLGPRAAFQDLSLDPAYTSVGENGPLLGAAGGGERVRVRLLYYAPSTPGALSERPVRVHAAGVDGAHLATLGPAADARRLRGLDEGDPDAAPRGEPFAGEMNALFPDLDVPAAPGGQRRLVLLDGEAYPADGAAPNTGQYLHTAGATFYLADAAGTFAGGHYWQVLADGSWDLAGYGADAPPTPEEPKQHTAANLAHYLDVTTLDPDQQPVLALYLAAERPDPPTQADFEAQAEAIVAQARAAFAAARLPAPVFLLAHAHRRKLSNHEEEDRERNEVFGRALRAVAVREPDVAFVSLYDLTGGTLFNGSEEARAWLLARGYDRFSFGRYVDGDLGTIDLATDAGHGGLLLDEGSVHPLHEDAASFFSWVLGRAVLGQPLPVAAEGLPGNSPSPLALRVASSPSARPVALVEGRGPVAIALYDALGRRLATAEVAAPARWSLPEGLPAGVYVVRAGGAAAKGGRAATARAVVAR